VNAQITSTIGELEAFIRDKDDALAIPREAAEFVHAAVLACGAKSGIEIGTSYGYSGLWAGAALAANGGRLITIDQDPAKHEVASRFFAQAGLDEVVRCETGLAMEVLQRMEGPIDYVLNDADKENCIAYVETLLDRLSPRAVVLTDNTLSHPDQLAAFCDWIRARDDFVSAHVPVGNGMEMSVFAAVN
jgi:predicted O-methyltransferase YrrM